jgi:hypothetical protein
MEDARFCGSGFDIQTTFGNQRLDAAAAFMADFSGCCYAARALMVSKS